MAEKSTEVIGRVHVRRWRAARPVHAVVIVHGYTEHAGRYAPLAATLVTRGADVFAPDHIGHGLSGGERAVMDDFDAVVDDVHRVTLNCAGGLPVVMIGHSMGGLIAARYAQRYPGRLAGLVLSAPAVGLAPLLESLLELPVIPEAGHDGSLLSRDPGVGDDYQKDPLVWHGPWQRSTLAAALVANRAVESGPEFGSMPLLYVHGSDDKIVPAGPARAVIDRIAGADTVMHLLPAQRHEIFNEPEKQALFNIVADFIDRVAVRPARS